MLDEKGRSKFFDLVAHRGEPHYYAFDLLWLNGIDLRSGPLLDRKQRLHRLIPANDSHLLYVEHLDDDGARFFELVCEQDLEGIICKPKTSPYPFTWIKVKNPNYSRAVGRPAMFYRACWINRLDSYVLARFLGQQLAHGIVAARYQTCNAASLFEAGFVLMLQAAEISQPAQSCNEVCLPPPTFHQTLDGACSQRRNRVGNRAKS